MTRLDKRLVDLAARHPRIMGALNYTAGQMLGDATLALNLKYDSYAALINGGRTMAEFTDLVDFSRVGGGGRFKPDGLFEYQSSGPRFDYDPSTLAAKGLLIEGQATNVWANSYTSENWVRGACSASIPSGVTGPDGVVGHAWKVTPFTSSVAKYARITTSTAGKGDGDLVAFRIALKADGYGIVRIQNYQAFGGGSGAGRIVYDLNSKALVSSTDDMVFSQIKQLPNGWVLFERICALNNTSSFSTVILSVDIFADGVSHAAPGDGVSGVLISMGERQDFRLTSHIPTSGSEITRSADYVNLPLNSWYNPSAGTLLLYHDVPSGYPLVASGANDLLTSGGAGLSILAWDAANIYRSNLGAAYDTVANPGISDSFKLLRNGADTLWANAHVSKILAFPRKLTVEEALAA